MVLDAFDRLLRRNTDAPAPRRVRGVRVDREIPVAPAPFIAEPEALDADQFEFTNWKVVHGGTFPEFVAWRWLVKVAQLTPEQDFFYQSSQFGGRQVPGGAVVDFEIRSHLVFWRIQGEFFHLGDVSVVGQDIFQKAAVESATSWRVVDLYETDLLERADYVCRQALQGIQVNTQN